MAAENGINKVPRSSVRPSLPRLSNDPSPLLLPLQPQSLTPLVPRKEGNRGKACVVDILPCTRKDTEPRYYYKSVSGAPFFRSFGGHMAQVSILSVREYGKREKTEYGQSEGEILNGGKNLQVSELSLEKQSFKFPPGCPQECRNKVSKCLLLRTA